MTNAHMTVVISGTFEEVRNKMIRVKDRLDNISKNGFRRYMSDEEWEYHTAEFDVCPTCVPLDGVHYRGDTLQYEFPDLIPLSTLKTKVNFVTPYHSAFRCKCHAQWLNFEECIITRVCEAILEA